MVVDVISVVSRPNTGKLKMRLRKKIFNRSILHAIRGSSESAFSEVYKNNGLLDIFKNEMLCN